MFRWPDGESRCIPYDYRLPRSILLSLAWIRWWTGVEVGGMSLRLIFLNKKHGLIAEAAAAAEADDVCAV